MACPLAPLQQHPSGFTGTLGSSRCAAAQHFTLCPQFSSAQAAFIFAGWDNTSAFFKTQVRSHTSWKPWRYCLPIWVKFTMLCVPRSTLVRPHHCWRGQVQCPASPNSLVCVLTTLIDTLGLSWFLDISFKQPHQQQWLQWSPNCLSVPVCLLDTKELRLGAWTGRQEPWK